MNAPAQIDMPERVRAEPPFGEFVALVAVVLAMVALGIDAMLPALPAIGEQLEVTRDNDRQYVVGAFVIGIGVGQLYPGTLSDRFGRRPVLLIGLTGFALCNIVAALAPSFELLLGARFASGLAAAAGRVAVTSMVRDRYVGRAMARVMSLAMIVFMGAPVIAPAVGQAVLLVGPWRWIFVVLGVWALGVAAWAWVRMPESLADGARIPLAWTRIAVSFAVVARDRQSAGYTLAAAFLSGGLFAFINSAQQIMADIFRRPDLLAPVFAGIAATMAIGALANSRLVVRLGMRRIGHAGLIAYALFAAVHLGIAATGQESLLTFVTLQALTMGAFGLCVGNFGALAMERLGAVAGTASSLQGTVQTMVGALIGLAIGQAFDGTTVPLYAGMVACVACALAAVLITERGRLFGQGSGSGA